MVRPNTVRASRHPVPNPNSPSPQLGFLTAKLAREFCAELWDLLLSAQENPSGIPAKFVEQKKEEIRKRQEEADRSKDREDRREDRREKQERSEIRGLLRLGDNSLITPMNRHANPAAASAASATMKGL